MIIQIAYFDATTSDRCSEVQKKYVLEKVIFRPNTPPLLWKSNIMLWQHIFITLGQILIILSNLFLQCISYFGKTVWLLLFMPGLKVTTNNSCIPRRKSYCTKTYICLKIVTQNIIFFLKMTAQNKISFSKWLQKK